jgi:spermidine/putrescine transport system permease protein
LLVLFSFLSQPASGGGVVWDPTTTAYRSIAVDTDFLGRSTVNWAYLEILGVSVLQALTCTIVCLLLSFPLALWMANQPPRRQAALMLLVTVPFWTNLLVRTYAWVLLLGDGGTVNDVLAGVGLGRQQLLYTPFATTIGLVYTALPFMVLPIYASLERFDFRLAEAAYDLGAHRGTVLRRVVYPAARPGIIAGLLLVFIPTLGAYVQPLMLGGGKELLVGTLIADQFGTARNWPLGSALSVVLMVFVLHGLLMVAAWSRRTGARVKLR